MGVATAKVEAHIAGTGVDPTFRMADIGVAAACEPYNIDRGGSVCRSTASLPRWYLPSRSAALRVDEVEREAQVFGLDGRLGRLAVATANALRCTA